MKGLWENDKFKGYLRFKLSGKGNCGIIDECNTGFDHQQYILARYLQP